MRTTREKKIVVKKIGTWNVRSVFKSGYKEKDRSKKKRSGDLQKRLGNKVKCYVQYSDRIILVKIDTKLTVTVIILVYIPNSEEEDEEVAIVYEKLDYLLRTVKSSEHFIGLGDIDATPGEGKTGNTVLPIRSRKKNETRDTLVTF